MAEKQRGWDATRIAIIVIVVMFLVSTVAFSGMVIWEQFFKKDNTAAVEDLASQQDNASCTMDQPTAAALAAPEIFKPGGDVTELQTTDIEEGTGEAVQAGDCLVTKYYGTLASDGTMFDENFTKETGLQFQVGMGQIIQGWDQGLIGMKEGGTRRIVIPSDLAYGENGSGTIPANADLVFVVKLDEIKKN